MSETLDTDTTPTANLMNSMDDENVTGGGGENVMDGKGTSILPEGATTTDDTALIIEPNTTETASLDNNNNNDDDDDNLEGGEAAAGKRTIAEVAQDAPAVEESESKRARLEEGGQVEGEINQDEKQSGPPKPPATSTTPGNSSGGPMPGMMNNNMMMPFPGMMPGFPPPYMAPMYGGFPPPMFGSPPPHHPMNPQQRTQQSTKQEGAGSESDKAGTANSKDGEALEGSSKTENAASSTPDGTHATAADQNNNNNPNSSNSNNNSHSTPNTNNNGNMPFPPMMNPMMMGYPQQFGMPSPAGFMPPFFMNPMAAAAAAGNPANFPRFRPPGRAGMVLAMACDVEQLSDYQILVRQQLELFEAAQEDVESNTQGRKKPVLLGQVGLRCRHCAPFPLRARGRGAVYYPAKLYGIYQAAQNMAGSHLCQACQHIPLHIKQELRKLRERRDNASGGKQYWADGCRALGLYEDDHCLRLKKLPSSPSGGGGAVTQSSQA